MPFLVCIHRVGAVTGWDVHGECGGVDGAVVGEVEEEAVGPCGRELAGECDDRGRLVLVWVDVEVGEVAGSDRDYPSGVGPVFDRTGPVADWPDL